MIGYGQIAKTREFNASNHVVYEAQYGYSSAKSSVASYRSYRQAWTGQPSAPPKVVARCSDSVTKVYVTWNGATDYDGWTIFAGISATNLSNVATFAKAGFETEYPLAGKYKYVVAEAKDGDNPLFNSTVISTGC